MSKSEVSPDRRWPLGRLAIVAGFVVVFVAMWYVGATGGLIVGAGPNGEGCRMFWGEAPESVGWSPDGEFLVVTTHNAEGYDRGDPGVRVFRWPGMALLSQTKAFGEPFTIDDLGVLTWQSVTSTIPTQTIAWRMEPGQTPAVDATGPTPDSLVGQTRPGAAVSAQGVIARVSDQDPDSSAQLCLESPPV